MGIMLPYRLETIACALDGKDYERVRLGFEALRDHLISTNYIVRKSQLVFAEKVFRIASAKEADAEQCVLDGAFLGCGHFGLACIERLNDDYDASWQHILKALDLAPQLTFGVFLPELKSFISASA
jgi:hypothetical protein